MENFLDGLSSGPEFDKKLVVLHTNAMFSDIFRWIDDNVSLRGCSIIEQLS